VYVLTPDGPVSWTEYVTGAKAQSSQPLAFDANILIHFPRDVWIQNEAQEIVTEVKGDIRVLAEEGELRLAGKVETVRGEVRLFSEPIVIKEGTITFTGGAKIDPRLDITAETNPGQYGVVTMTVQGPVSAPKIEFTSDQPQYDTADALAILVIGKPLSEAGPGGDQKIESKLEALAAGALSGIARKQLADKVPIDFLQIKANSFSSADLRVGKYVTPRLFIVYRRRLGERTEDENANEAQAEYQLSREVYIQTFYGDQNIWGGEVFWRHYY
jgi:autotransporter translocation and assembly factor TamB